MYTYIYIYVYTYIYIYIRTYTSGDRVIFSVNTDRNLTTTPKGKGFGRNFGSRFS